MAHRWHLLFPAFLLFAGTSAAQTNVKDHPLVSRFQGSDVVEYKAVEFDEFPLALGPIVDEKTWTKAQTVEGKVTKFKYTTPAQRSTLEVIRSYQDALQKGGFQTLYTCVGKECFSPKFAYGYTNTASGIWCTNCEDQMRYLAAKLPRSAGDVYVSVLVDKDKYEGGTWLTIVESKPIGTGLVTVNAAALANAIADTGHASVYGIYFDTGKAIVKPESDPTLAEIAKLMTSDKQLKLHVIGNTDNVGTLAANMALSKQRADAVVNTLVMKYQVPAARLLASGIGPLAPVATNRTDEGKAKNRRVELVEQ
jgi:OmpA-OmpF porin, OOP family